MKLTASLILFSALLAANTTVAQDGHYYTTNRSERDMAIGTQGHQARGIAGYVFKKPSPSKRLSIGPVYHANYSYSQDQACTSILDDQNHAINLGYQDMGIAWYRHTKPSACRAPL